MAAEVDTADYARAHGGKGPEESPYRLWTFRNVATGALFHTSGKYRQALGFLRDEQNRLRKDTLWRVLP
jgi:hypothetical protein